MMLAVFNFLRDLFTSPLQLFYPDLKQDISLTPQRISHFLFQRPWTLTYFIYNLFLNPSQENRALLGCHESHLSHCHSYPTSILTHPTCSGPTGASMLNVLRASHISSSWHKANVCICVGGGLNSGPQFAGQALYHMRHVPSPFLL
jgi:hypothetical protein